MARPLERPALDWLDVAVVGYLALPLGIFLIGWLEPWVALPLFLALLYALRTLGRLRRLGAVGRSAAPRPFPSGWQVTLAIAAGCAWTICGGIGHFMFANADWHIRDAVLHDLVTGAWPVGYGDGAGGPTLLRAPIGYYLPAAIVGKMAGLAAAHAALAIWTAAGASLFLLQVLSLMPRRVVAALASVALIVSFSGLDAVGTLLRAPGALAHWDVTRHLEWWAERYQYSSMTTQLFWVPNHALGAWLTVGLLHRPKGLGAVEPLLPITVVAVALWSPLAALGLVPFVLWRMWETPVHERPGRWLDLRVWAPALAVGLVIAAYLTLDAGRIPRGWTVGRHGFGPAAIADDLWRQAEFFLLEAGLIGFSMLAIRRSARVVLALGVLAVLPVVCFGANNDFVMRVSIPSLAVLAIGACLALFVAPCPAAAGSAPGTANPGLRKAILVALLLIGAVTPFQEFARAAALGRWSPNPDATLIDASCGGFMPHYVARLRSRPVAALLRVPHALAIGRAGPQACENPAVRAEQRRAAGAR